MPREYWAVVPVGALASAEAEGDALGEADGAGEAAGGVYSVLYR
jgi:hypothetical protein